MQGEPTKCPYSCVCECPGGLDFKPVEGLWRQEDGILCLDWNVFLPYNLAANLRTTEGRHLTDAVEAADKLDEARRRWGRSPKRKAAQRKYLNSPKGQATVEKYQDSETFRLAQQKYRETKKGQEAFQRQSDKIKSLRAISKWLRENPSRTIDDYFREHNG